MNKSMELLNNYEELKSLYIKYIASNRRLKKVLNKSPKKFIKYINKNFVICESWACVVLEGSSVFISTKETKEEAEALAEKFENINNDNLIVNVEIKKYLKLK